MKITCDVAQDLLPLYVEKIASADSIVLVEEHIASCENCKKELEKLGLSDSIPIDSNIAPLKKLQSDLRKRKYLTILLSILLTLTLAIITMCFLTAPNYLPYADDTMTVKETSDGTMLVIFGKNITGYDVNKYLSSDETGYHYHITTWNSLWNRNMSKSNIRNVVLNPNGEKVTSVYYYLTDGNDDILVYGADQSPRVTLPRLFLSYYAVIAFCIAVVCGVALFLLRKRNKAKNVITNILLIPIAYLLAHLCVRGFVSVSYSATRDFWAILLVSVPIYFILYIIKKRFAFKKMATLHL